MTSLFRKVADLRPGEARRVAIMSGYVFAVIASYNVLKPMTRSLFVSELGLQKLPLLYMMLAVVVGLFITAYLRYSARVRLDRLITTTTGLLILSLAMFRWLLQAETESEVLYYTFFIWASIYGVLTTTQFWLLANYVFNSREAKRLFPVLTASGLLGAIVGGYFTRFLVKQIGGTPNLAFFCIILLCVVLGLAKAAWRHREQTVDVTRRVKPPAAPDHIFKLIAEVGKMVRSSRHLAFILGIVGLTYMVVQIADFQFVAFASQEMQSVDDLTGFLGFWLSNLSVIALIFQLSAANVILQRFGVGATILILPIALFITSAWVFLSYSLISVLAIKVGDGAFRHSIHKVGMELLYLPLHAEVKKKTKAVIDMFVDRFARGMAGVILLIFFTYLGWSVPQISLVALVLIVAWVVLSYFAYAEYVDSFRQAIARRSLDLEAVQFSIKDQKTITSLLFSLASKNDRQVVYALKLLQSVTGVELEAPLRPLLKHASADVRYYTLALIYNRGLRKLLNDVRPLLRDVDERVSAEAVRIVAEFSEDATHKLVSEWLHGDDQRLRGGALNYLAENGELAKDMLTPETIESFLRWSADEREQLARALGILQEPETYTYLLRLLQDSDTAVKVRAIQSAGKTGDRQFIPILIDYLNERNLRKVTREALARYGDGIAAELSDALQDESRPLELRINITRVLSRIGSQKVVDLLLSQLCESEERLRYYIIKALNKLRDRFQEELNFDERVDEALLDEIEKYLRILATLHMSSQVETSSHRADSLQQQSHALLLRALQERLDDHLERLFRLLGLCYRPRDIYNAFAATVSGNKIVRANAIEFLDNILSNQHKRILLPILDDLPVEQILKLSNGLFDIHFSSRSEALSYLLQNDDALLRACAIYEVGVSGLAAEFKDQIEAAKTASVRIVRETAELVSQRLSQAQSA